mmetsp:Transcript_41673/g.107872  ORF Transcript_41673/g.107872 Transcript_41673/m.107872 type:complete len:245 (-) Transcript_41673:872-1606(-)
MGPLPMRVRRRGGYPPSTPMRVQPMDLPAPDRMEAQTEIVSEAPWAEARRATAGRATAGRVVAASRRASTHTWISTTSESRRRRGAPSRWARRGMTPCFPARPGTTRRRPPRACTLPWTPLRLTPSTLGPVGAMTLHPTGARHRPFALVTLATTVGVTLAATTVGPKVRCTPCHRPTMAAGMATMIVTPSRTRPRPRTASAAQAPCPVPSDLRRRGRCSRGTAGRWARSWRPSLRRPVAGSLHA